MTLANRKPVLIATATMAFTALLAPPVTSAETDVDAARYTMTVFQDTSSGRKVVGGEYASAIEEINSAGKRMKSKFASLTSLCVAYTKSGKLEKAAEYCDAAIARVEKRKRAKSYERDLAVALANRGVLHAVAGDNQLARQDFEQALLMRTDLAAPAINLARLDRG